MRVRNPRSKREMNQEFLVVDLWAGKIVKEEYKMGSVINGIL